MAQWKRWATLAALALALAQCSRRNRVGEHIWVMYEGVPVRAYIVERTGESRVRVQFEGCDSTWQREITTDRITERVNDTEAARPPTQPACAPSSASHKGESLGLALPYKVGDRLRVRWRNSTYNATVVGVVPPDSVRVHYEGLETAWDETITSDRIEGSR